MMASGRRRRLTRVNRALESFARNGGAPNSYNAGVSRIRAFAVMLVVLLVPVQGLAAACAQLCVKAQAARHLVAVDVAAAHGHADCSDPADPAGGEGKCCHAHTFMMEPPLPPSIVDVPSFQPLRFIADWTSFIPEEPSPPPIASVR